MIGQVAGYLRYHQGIQPIDNVSFGHVTGPNEAVLVLPTWALLHSTTTREETIEIDLFALKAPMDQALQQDRISRCASHSLTQYINLLKIIINFPFLFLKNNLITETGRTKKCSFSEHLCGFVECQLRIAGTSPIDFSS